MPSITQRGDRFIVRVRVQGHPNHTSTFATYDKALKWGQEIETRLKNQAKDSGRKLENDSLRAALLRYKQTVTPTKKGCVQEGNRIDLILRQYPDLVRQSLGEIDGPTIAEFRDSLVGSGYSPATVKRYVDTLKVVFKIARYEWGYRELPDPFLGLRMPSIDNARCRRLSPQELDALIESCDRHPSYWLKPFVILAVETAMRRAELVNLEWDRVDLQNRRARLDQTKNGRRRFVPLSAKAIKWFEFLRERSTNERVFPVYPDAVTGAFITAVRRAKIRDFRLHDLRHEAVSRLIEKGLSIFEVKEVTGQRTSTIVERYTHLRQEDILRKMD